MRAKSISEMGSVRLPTRPTLNSRPATYSCTSTSSNCSVIAATRAGDRDAGELQRAHHMLLPLALAMHALAQIEDEVGPPRDLKPPHVVPHGDLADLVSQRAENGCDLVHGFHHAADVIGCPVRGPGVVQDDDSHADTAAVTSRSSTMSCPPSRRHAMRTTSWISSS